MAEFKELEEFEEEYWKSDWSRMDLFLAEKVRQQQKEIERLRTIEQAYQATMKAYRG